VDAAELGLKRLGYRVLRVRHLGATARVELAADELAAALTPAGRSAIEAAVRAAGYEHVEVSEEPFRSGSLNTLFLGRLPSPAGTAP
jgi:uncharacterized protein